MSNILLVSSLYDQGGGGVAKVVNFLANQAILSGHKVIVVTTHKERKLKIEEVNGIKIYRFRPKNLYWIGEKDKQPTIKKVAWQIIDTFNLQPYLVLKQIIDIEKPDIVHFHKIRSFSSSIWKAPSNIPSDHILQTCHDYEAISPIGTLVGEIGKLAKEQGVLVNGYRSIRKSASKSIGLVTSPSKFTLDLIKKYGFFPNAHVRVIPNTHGLTLSQLESNRETSLSKTQLSDDFTIRFLYLGRLEQEKGIELLCDVFASLRNLERNVILNVVGWGKSLDKLRSQYDSNERININGPLYGAEKEREILKADALIVPSLWPEVFGIVIVEAYAFGKPVLASRIGGIPEIVKENLTGYLFSPDSKFELQDLILRIVDNPRMILKCSKDCFEYAREFTSENIFSAYNEYYT